MANSFVRYTGNGSTDAYAVPFSYRAQADVNVTIDAVATSAYTWDGAGTTITFTTAPANLTSIEIRRTTSQAARLVDYADGSVLKENDLDTDSFQGFYMGQEAIDDANDRIKLDNADFQWDAQSKRIKNVADPTANTDAVNKQFISTNIPNITTVAGIAADVTTVAGISANVTSVASNAANINLVAGSIGSVNTVAADIAKVIAVANDLAEAVSEVETVADDLNEATSEIDTVATSITNVDAVGTNIANVNTLAPISANITTVAGISANVTSVAGVSANVTTVAGIASNVTTVAGISSNVTTVAGDTTNIGNVAGAIANVNLVGGSIANVNLTGGSIANVNTVATNIAAVNSFANTYRIASSAPVSSLDIGDLYFDTTANELKVYKSSGWAAAGSTVNGTSARFNYTATAAQTTFTGADTNGETLAYDAGFADVYLNGVRLSGADITITSGTSVVLAAGASAGDLLDIVAYGTFNVATVAASAITSGTISESRLPASALGAVWESKSNDFTAEARKNYFCDTSSNDIDVTLPSGTIGDEIRFLDVAGNFSTNDLTILYGSSKIQGASSNLDVATDRAGFALVYYNSTQGWLLKDV